MLEHKKITHKTKGYMFIFWRFFTAFFRDKKTQDQYFRTMINFQAKVNLYRKGQKERKCSNEMGKDVYSLIHTTNSLP